MNLEAIFHKIDSEYAYALSEKEFYVKIRVKKGDFEKISLIYFDKYKFIKGEANKYVAEMSKFSSDKFFDYYNITVEVDMISIIYCFELKSNDKTLYYSNYDFYKEVPKEDRYFFLMPFLCNIFEFPKWAITSVIYQIFPDRFFSSRNISENKWYGKVNCNTFLGGDIPGITQKLDYIAELGINVIYLTPIFESCSNHKYNIRDYYKIDSAFGTNSDLKELIEKAHKKGIRIILDAVFNHSGHDFFAFQDILKNQENSIYKDWFKVKEFPIKFEDNPKYWTFGYSKWMPKFNTKNPEVINYLINVACYWIREFDIDGWRIDVANEVDHDFWRKFRDAVKKIKKDVFIIGEIWHDSSSWLLGDQFDSVMNYMFTDIVIDYIANETIDAETFANKAGFIIGLYKKEVLNILWNLIDSHDTRRFLTACSGRIEKLKLALILQITFPGIPMIYYGDEVGMEGEKDPDCRRGMIWGSRQNLELFNFYKKMILIRKNYRTLIFGNYFDIKDYYKYNVYSFGRIFEDEELRMYINNSPSKCLINDYGIELITETKIENNFELMPYSGAIIKRGKKNEYKD